MEVAHYFPRRPINGDVAPCGFTFVIDDRYTVSNVTEGPMRTLRRCPVCMVRVECGTA